MSRRWHDSEGHSSDAMPAGAPPVPIRFRGRSTLTLRQIDAWNGAPKGTAFRRFKATRSLMIEGGDYFRLDAATDAGLIEALRHRALIYRSSVHVVLLTESGYRHLVAASDKADRTMATRGTRVAS